MTLYGLIAHPAGHSRSPLMQNKMIDKYNIDAHYHAFDVLPEQLEHAVKGLRALHVGGFNVSTPFKNNIIKYLDEISPIAEQLQAVNTVKNVQGRLIGTNTDGDGFWQSINSRQPKETVVIFGTGGAARAVIATAKQYGVRKLIVFNRVHSDWWARQQEISRLTNGGGYLEDLANNHELTEALKQADMLINATTVGMNDSRTLLTDYQVSLLPQHALVVDMIYRNQQTTMLKSANQRGLLTLNGLPMLVNQGALSFEYWFNKLADRKLMMKEIEE
ncbi:shikimate dehydrogenase (NADP(+)) [Leuconostoc litchii]|uniref:Shikimate dehydrogenase (NADP(+)) n=1 Tax=Leuconostoc litchii TaxID=1981069 RepID=A0A6P2CM27_9LACO|nr:shikimate dehydrogenase [Leuconostoc litchii]TYC46936.1 shikimate dehydrogenase [Leuconostoc litchii]GMA68840.1 shikimate dehydrogenase (NADP(+)) [Leuconostoc litchii]